MINKTIFFDPQKYAKICIKICRVANVKKYPPAASPWTPILTKKRENFNKSQANSKKIETVSTRIRAAFTKPSIKEGLVWKKEIRIGDLHEAKTLKVIVVSGEGKLKEAVRFENPRELSARGSALTRGLTRWFCIIQEARWGPCGYPLCYSNLISPPVFGLPFISWHQIYARLPRETAQTLQQPWVFNPKWKIVFPPRRRKRRTRKMVKRESQELLAASITFYNLL